MLDVYTTFRLLFKLFWMSFVFLRSSVLLTSKKNSIKGLISILTELLTKFQWLFEIRSLSLAIFFAQKQSPHTLRVWFGVIKSFFNQIDLPKSTSACLINISIQINQCSRDLESDRTHNFVACNCWWLKWIRVKWQSIKHFPVSIISSSIVVRLQWTIRLRSLELVLEMVVARWIT